jgi:hypothetical protein
MKTWIVLEGESNLAFLKALLPDEIQTVTEFVIVGGRSNISSIARTVLVKHREPVAVVLNADTLDPATIWEKQVTTEQLLRAVSGGTRFKLILCIPALEAVFFNAPEILERIFPKWPILMNPMYYSKLPKEALADLFTNGGGPTTLSEFLDALTEEDAEHLRATGPIRELINFVSEVTNPIGIPGPI